MVSEVAFFMTHLPVFSKIVLFVNKKHCHIIEEKTPTRKIGGMTFERFICCDLFFDFVFVDLLKLYSAFENFGPAPKFGHF